MYVKWLFFYEIIIFASNFILNSLNGFRYIIDFMKFNLKFQIIGNSIIKKTDQIC